MLLEIGRTLTFFLSLLSLYPVFESAFFVPGSHWQERLALALARTALAGCVCFASGLLFSHRPLSSGKPDESLTSTLPVQMYFCAMAGMVVLFALSWYLEEFFVPFLWRNQP